MMIKKEDYPFIKTFILGKSLDLISCLCVALLTAYIGRRIIIDSYPSLYSMAAGMLIGNITGMLFGMIASLFNVLFDSMFHSMITGMVVGMLYSQKNGMELPIILGLIVWGVLLFADCTYKKQRNKK